MSRIAAGAHPPKTEDLGPKMADHRFWSHVDFSGDCWQWAGSTDRLGYGHFSGGLAHRFAYQLLVEPIQDELDHLCRNRGCVNPDHLEQVDHRTNVLRGTSVVALYGKSAHCVNGHPFDEINSTIRYTKNGRAYRRCLVCERRRTNAYGRSEKGRATGQAWADANREKVRASARESQRRRRARLREAV